MRPAPILQPVQSAPVYQAPVYQAPVYQAPVNQAPVQSAPVYQAPVNQAPVQQDQADSLFESLGLNDSTRLDLSDDCVEVDSEYHLSLMIDAFASTSI
jgi:hypothetical protein